MRIVERGGVSHPVYSPMHREADAAPLDNSHYGLRGR